MSVTGYTDLKEHVGHDLKCVVYGDPDDPENVAVECQNCNEVIIDFDRGQELLDLRDRERVAEKFPDAG